ncbi:TetR/AcrR family transcriptional regulator [Amycolatopsis sp. YIM 10]|uniref:TetR/AcrR family transcriptional regulator n=1 Tax=Amycolatopsis sp. YIM 10 TaxID=2653857 RepID=UPI0012900B75|nr:TetR family transcriptional regulator [Amycolatopsis sp. YIM 10]QFU92018.1 HTH-type transcriptional repressor KstR2 [Amycolatopsis sp. YIM 10]
MPTSADDSFIRAARRRQLVECAVEMIAEHGLAEASTVRIAKHAGVSRGVLTYHFRDRAELLNQVVRRVYELGAEVIGPAVTEAASPREALLAFIGGSVELHARYPRHLAALTEIFAAEARHDEQRRHARELDDLAAILRAGQEQGQFRAFDIDVMATTIRRALDGALAAIAGGVPADRYATELREIFDAATRL